MSKSTRQRPEPSPAKPNETTDSGVDRSLIRWMLSLTPTERLLAVQQQVNAVQEVIERLCALRETTGKTESENVEGPDEST